MKDNTSNDLKEILDICKEIIPNLNLNFRYYMGDLILEFHSNEIRNEIYGILLNKDFECEIHSSNQTDLTVRNI